jgi:hypothetical protein
MWRTGREDPARTDRQIIGARGILEDIESFDDRLFGLTKRAARIVSPQRRLVLEWCWEALENAGDVQGRIAGRHSIQGAAPQPPARPSDNELIDSWKKLTAWAWANARRCEMVAFNNISIPIITIDMRPFAARCLRALATRGGVPTSAVIPRGERWGQRCAGVRAI